MLTDNNKKIKKTSKRVISFLNISTYFWTNMTVRYRYKIYIVHNLFFKMFFNIINK